MKSRESLVRLKGFQVTEKRRQLQQLQSMMAEFERMAKELEAQIGIEEKNPALPTLTILPIPPLPRQLASARTTFRSLSGN